MTDYRFYQAASFATSEEEGVNLTYNFFKVSPFVLNPIFAIKSDKTVDTDQFSVNCFFDVKTVAPLDYNGMPY